MRDLAAARKTQQKRSIGAARAVGAVQDLLGPCRIKVELAIRETVLVEVEKQLTPFTSEFDRMAAENLGETGRDVMRTRIVAQHNVTCVSQSGTPAVEVESRKIQRALGTHIIKRARERQR